MALTSTNNYISTLVSAGNDAQSHLYEVLLQGGLISDEMTTSLSIRCKGFRQPKIKQDSYEQKYITAYVSRPRAKIDVERSFDLIFRVDDNYMAYRALLNQQKIMFNAPHSYVNSDINTLIEEGKLFNVQVNIVPDLEEGEQETVRLFSFKNCWIESITPSAYSNDKSDPITVTCRIKFLSMEDWQSGITGDKNHSESSLDR